MNRLNSKLVTARTLVLITLLFTIALPLAAQDDRFELKFGKDLPFQRGRVTIDHAFGGLTVRTGQGSEVAVRATIRSSDDEIGKQIRIHATEGTDGVLIRTEVPDLKNFSGRLSYSVEMNVTVPANAPVTAKNRFGSIDARGLATSVIDSRHGSVKFHDGRGAQSISTSFGSIDVSGNRGDMKISTSNGSVMAREIDGLLNVINRFGSTDVAGVKRAVNINTSNGSVLVNDAGALTVVNRFASVTASSIDGPADITNSNGKVSLSNVNGPATVRNSFGAISLDDIRGSVIVDAQNSKVEGKKITGDAKVETGFGGVKLEQVGGSADITSANGSITVSDIGGGLTTESTFGSVHADRVKGGATVKGANGSVTLNDLGGDVRVRTSFGPVFIDGVAGAIDIGNTNGAIAVTGVRSTTCRPITLQTSFGAIRVALPPSATFNVSAQTSFGRATTDFPITTTSVSGESIQGTIGRGGCRLNLVNRNGGITIAKE